MKKLISVLSLGLAAATTQAASSNIQFIADNASLETSLCVVAAQNGFDAALAEAKRHGKNAFSAVNTKCNGESIKAFAKSFEATPIITAAPKEVVVITGNQSEESLLCLKAVKEGVQAVGHKASSLTCNGQSVSNFVKTIKNS